MYQHPKINADKLDEVMAVFAEKSNLYPESFISGIEKLGVTPIQKLMGENYTKLWPEITRKSTVIKSFMVNMLGRIFNLYNLKVTLITLLIGFLLLPRLLIQHLATMGLNEKLMSPQKQVRMFQYNCIRFQIQRS